MKTRREIGAEVCADPVAAMRRYCPDDSGLLLDVPEHLRAGLARYAILGILPGDFLRAALRNDLKGAVGRADDVCGCHLAEIVRFMYNDLPGQAWGDAEKVAAWAKRGGLLGETELQGGKG